MVKYKFFGTQFVDSNLFVQAFCWDELSNQPDRSIDILLLRPFWPFVGSEKRRHEAAEEIQLSLCQQLTF